LLLVPLDLAPGLAYLVRGTCRTGVFEGRLTRPAYFMPLRDEDDEGRDNAPTSSSLLPPPDPLPSVSAPWADWSERRASHTGPGLLQSLAFLGWLHGHTIAYQALADSRTMFGIGDLVHGHACWLGWREWRVTGTAGRDLGNRLWRAFLDAGGPWPTEFQLYAVPLENPLPEVPASDFVFQRQGPRCRQIWTLKASRERSAWS
jgi:hypothetical protein